MAESGWMAAGTGASGCYLLFEEKAGGAKGKVKGPFPGGPVDPFVMALRVEGRVAFNAYLASLSPGIYGGSAIALAPVGAILCEGCEKPEAIVGGIAFAGIGACNLSLDEDKLSSGAILRKNVVAWHLAGAAVGVTVYATRHPGGKPGDGEEGGEENGGSLRLSPVPGGVRLGYSYRFR